MIYGERVGQKPMNILAAIYQPARQRQRAKPQGERERSLAEQVKLFEQQVPTHPWYLKAKNPSLPLFFLHLSIRQPTFLVSTSCHGNPSRDKEVCFVAQGRRGKEQEAKVQKSTGPVPSLAFLSK